ncbi:hypothetical protein B0H21DRAFT_10348 [Amylocystis lapponica]|nr:hypothetical protein B0H21DRAFT_10348 [Amylocystis lapponica]
MTGPQAPSSTRGVTRDSPSPSERQGKPENRRTRRRHDRERGEIEGRPSTSANGVGKSSTAEDNAAGKEKDTGIASAKSPGQFTEADFIAFAFSDEEQDAEELPVREWDKGKGRVREWDSGGRKRKADEYNAANDGYTNKKQRVAAASRKAPWVVDLDWESCTNVAEMLHRDVEAFVKYISPTPEEDEVRSLVVQMVSRAVTQAFPDAQVLPFGSYETKLYLPIGDIDLVIYSQSMAYSGKETVLHAIANAMKRSGITDRVRIIAKAKVPIVKFVTTHGNFSVDISINQGNGVTAGKMIKQYVAELPALRSLVLVIKSFLSQRSMNEVYTGGLGSYSIVCLAISFLQMHPKIRRGEIDPSRNLGILVMEFFELYGCYFNYSEVGISLRDGGTYYNKAERGWLDYGQPRLLSIEDPGDPSNDISRGSYGIVKVRTTLAGAHGIMTAAAYLQAGIISARREGRRVSLRGAEDAGEMSILASVMGVTQETINHRRVVQEVYERKTMHRILGLTPQATIALNGSQPKRNAKSRTAEQESIKSAWEEADMDLASGSDHEGHAGDPLDEDEGRYGIDRRRKPPRKRRDTRNRQDPLPVYTTDEDDVDPPKYTTDKDEVDGTIAGYDHSISEEELAYALSAGEDGKAEDLHTSATTRKADESRRSYWLSKGGIASDSSDIG